MPLFMVVLRRKGKRIQAGRGRVKVYRRTDNAMRRPVLSRSTTCTAGGEESPATDMRGPVTRSRVIFVRCDEHLDRDRVSGYQRSERPASAQR